jgi:hypothetical protein
MQKKELLFKKDIFERIDRNERFERIERIAIR